MRGSEQLNFQVNFHISTVCHPFDIQTFPIHIRGLTGNGFESIRGETQSGQSSPVSPSMLHRAGRSLKASPFLFMLALQAWSAKRRPCLAANRSALVVIQPFGFHKLECISAPFARGNGIRKQSSNPVLGPERSAVRLEDIKAQ